MSESFIHTEPYGPVALVTVRRPPANAFELESTRQLTRAISTLVSDKHVGAIVLTGSGDCFSAGLDLKIVPRYERAEQRAMVRELGVAILSLYGSPKPVVAAINGHAVAAGTLFALCCDYRAGPESAARFGLTGARVGIPYPDAALEVITSELGTRESRRVLLSALTFGVEDAFAKGIVDEVVPVDRVVPRAIEMAKDLAGLPADNYTKLKYQLRSDSLNRIRTSLEIDPALEKWI